MYFLLLAGKFSKTPRDLCYSKKMSQSTCFFGNLLKTPCGSYTHGEIVFDETTTIDKCTRDITSHLRVLWLNPSVELNSEADLIMLRAGKSIYTVLIFIFSIFV